MVKSASNLKESRLLTLLLRERPDVGEPPCTECTPPPRGRVAARASHVRRRSVRLLQRISIDLDALVNMPGGPLRGERLFT